MSLFCLPKQISLKGAKKSWSICLFNITSFYCQWINQFVQVILSRAVPSIRILTVYFHFFPNVYLFCHRLKPAPLSLPHSHKQSNPAITGTLDTTNQHSDLLVQAFRVFMVEYGRITDDGARQNRLARTKLSRSSQEQDRKAGVAQFQQLCPSPNPRQCEDTNSDRSFGKGLVKKEWWIFFLTSSRVGSLLWDDFCGNGMKLCFSRWGRRRCGFALTLLSQLTESDWNCVHSPTWRSTRDWNSLVGVSGSCIVVEVCA